MPNNVNISDYEKIIFVNNISENNSQKDLITDQNYGFAVFFTNNTDVPANWPSSAWGPKIKNIWYGGQRLNRFVGIDQNNCTLSVGNHTVKLTFNYEKGLLGISDTNKLSKIEFVSLNFIDAYTGNLVETNNYNNVINAKDNTFTLTIRFFAESDTGVNVSKIAEGINIKCESNYPNIQLLNYAGETVSEDELSADRQYRFKIIYDTEHPQNSSNNRSYTIVPDYDNSKSLKINLTLRLNPTSIEVRNRINSSIITSKTYNDLSEDVTEIYDVNILPNNGEAYTYPLSHTNRKLYLHVNSSNPNAVTINGNNGDAYIEVGYSNYFELTMHKAEMNTTNSSTITVSVVYGDDHNSFRNSNLEYSFRITIGGATGGMYYVGYENPTLDTFDVNLLQPLEGITTLYDWETSTLEDNTERDFYVVIPATDVEYISPRWDAFTLSGNTKKYNHFAAPCNTWTTRFIQLGDKNLKNINCAIFKSISTHKGKFYGKIQKTN